MIRRIVEWAKFRSSVALLSFRSVVRWYVRELQMSRTSALRSYFEAVNRLPSSSSSSGFEAGLLTRKSSTGSTIPEPLKWAQTRLANDAANHGFLGEASHSARTTRRSLPSVVGHLAAEELRLHHARRRRGGSCSPPPELKMMYSRWSSPCFWPICEKNAANW